MVADPYQWQIKQVHFPISKIGLPLLVALGILGCSNDEPNSSVASQAFTYKQPTVYSRSQSTLPYGEFKPPISEKTPILPQLKKEKPTGLVTIKDGVAFSSSSSWAGNDTEWLPMGEMAVLLDDESPSLHIITQVLVMQLQDLPHFEQITIYPPGELPRNGSLIPDLTLRLKIANESDAEEESHSIKFIGGSGLMGNIQPRYQSGEPPLPNWTVHGEVEPLYASGWHDDPHLARKVAKSVSEKLVELLRERLSELRKQRALLPELPAGFYPQYRTTPDIESLLGYQVREIYSLRGMLTPNHTCWEFTADLAPENVFTKLAEKLKSHGWQEQRTYLSEEATGNNFIDLYHPHRNTSLRIGNNWKNENLFLFGTNNPNRFFAVSRELMKAEERLEAVDQFLEQSPSPEQLAVLPAILNSRNNHPQITNALEQAAPAMAIEDLFQSVNYLHRTARNAAAASKLHSMACLQMMGMETSDDLQEELEEQAKNFKLHVDAASSDSELIPFTLNPGQLKEFGILEPRDIIASQTLIRKVGQPVIIRVSKQQFVAINVYQNRPLLDDQDGPPTKPLIFRVFRIEGDYNEADGRYSSWSHSNFTQQVSAGEQHEVGNEYLKRFKLTCNIADDGKTYQLSASQPIVE